MIKKFFERLKNFFREDCGEVVSAYFNGEKIFIVRLTNKFETTEIEFGESEPEQLAEKISFVCAQNDWKTSAVGFCLRADDVVTFQSDVANVPEKEIPALVKSWAMSQSGADAEFSFAKVGNELWMETLPRVKVKEFVAAFKKFGMNLRGLSAMPSDLLTKIYPFERTEFISEVVRDKKSPNLLKARSASWNLEKISAAVAAIFFIGMIISSIKLFIDYNAALDKLDEAKISVEKFSDELVLKKNLDAEISELHKINALAAQIKPEKNFNLLINLGKISSDDVRLTKIRAEENFLEVEGLTDDSDAVRNYLARVRNSVIKSARLENSSERDDGDIVFVIRADFK